jgi:hypothetical protein
MIAESVAELVLVVLAVAASASAGRAAHEVEAQVDAQAREWARFVFSCSEADQLVGGSRGCTRPSPGSCPGMPG